MPHLPPTEALPECVIPSPDALRGTRERLGAGVTSNCLYPLCCNISLCIALCLHNYALVSVYFTMAQIVGCGGVFSIQLPLYVLVLYT